MDFDLDRLVRGNIKQLVPYSSARSEFVGGVDNLFLDANENAFGSPLPTHLNRYPDPLQLRMKQKIAEMEADYQMSHLLWLRAGYLKNEGQPNARATSLAKWQATTRSEKAASMAIEVHGANGYSNDYPVERYLRNCKAAITYEGTRDIHTLMQADWALGLKKEKAARRTLPAWKK